MLLDRKDLMGLADLHIHSIHSHDGTCTVPGILRYASAVAGLDVLAITDHDEIAGSLEALELAPQFNIDVIPGSEITTREGHLLGLFIQERIPAGMCLVDTLLEIGRQNGIAVAAHPEARWVPSLSSAALKEAMNHPAASRVLVGIESFNAGLIHRPSNINATRIARQTGLAPCGSSDSHVVWTVGTAVTAFPGSSKADLRRALFAGTTKAMPRNNPGPVSNIFSWLYHAALRRSGWVNSFTDINHEIGLVRLHESSSSG